MRQHYLSLVDSIIWWEKIGVSDAGTNIYAPPIVIAGKWDIVQTDAQTEDTIELQVPGNALYPDRVLGLGSMVMCGGQAELDALTLEQQADPCLIREARSVKSESTIMEFGVSQKANYPPGFQSVYLVVECRC